MGLYRELVAARPDAFRADLAMALNNLANGLSALGRREEALAAAQEAVGLYRDLAAIRPDAFRPNLAISLMSKAGVLDGVGKFDDALIDNAEALEFERIQFEQYPAASAPRLSWMIDEYIARCEKCCREADWELLGPLIEALRRLQGREKDAGGQANG